uniref:Uncharacterized protein n=1 Tax=Arabidopsis thaliana TaxID=3702 RepID=Q0WTM3_ARATH|nr:hypothetical protein [Arabidopsis thaliana]
MQFLCELIDSTSKEEEDVFRVLVYASDECNWDISCCFRYGFGRR